MTVYIFKDTETSELLLQPLASAYKAAMNFTINNITAQYNCRPLYLIHVHISKCTLHSLTR